MDETAKKIALERLRTMPSNMRLMIGGEGKFDKEMLMQEVEKESDIGELIVEVYLHGLRSFKSVVNI